jgi:hypothetical protein
MATFDEIFTAPTPADLLAAMPEARYERVLAFQNYVIDYVAGGTMPREIYETLRRELISDPHIAHLVPDFIRSNRDIGALWEYAKSIAPKWAPRRQHVREAFAPLLDHLEKRGSPAEGLISETLSSFDPDGVHGGWDKALKRAEGDPEGAITAARALLESVCKHILDDEAAPGTGYGPGDDLPKLYRLASEKLNLAPSQHSEEAFKRILGGATSVVEGLGSLRNKVGDAHGKGKRPVKPQARHAHLSVNMAGAMALFLVQTWESRSTPQTEKAGPGTRTRKPRPPPPGAPGGF